MRLFSPWSPVRAWLNRGRAELSPIAFHKWPWSRDWVDGAAKAGAAGQTTDPRSRLEAEIRDYCGLGPTDAVALAGSGRTALRLGLSALSRLVPTRKRVVCPTYCCQSVLAAILASDLVPVFIDTGPELNSSADQYIAALSDEVLCVVVVNLCGKRLDDASRRAVLDACRARGIFTIEDDAQNCQAQPTPRTDMEIHSFGFGKLGMATAGGALIYRRAGEQIALELEDFLDEPESAASDRFEYFSAKYSSSEVTEHLAARYNQANARFERTRMTRLDAELALATLRRAPEIVARGVAIGQRLSQTVARFPHVYGYCGIERNIFFRFPVILRGVAEFNRFWTHMSSRGIELEGMYVPLHLRFPELHAGDSLVCAEMIYGRIFNVPNRVSLSEEELTKICDALEAFGRECPT